MERKDPIYPSQEPHEKAQNAIDHAREVRENKLADRGKIKTELGARLTADGSLLRCSICGYPFAPDEKPSMSVAFAEHLFKAHELGQTSEKFDQATTRKG